MGFLARDLELRYGQSGTAVGNTALAVNRKWKDQGGTLKEEVSFIDLTFFGSTAENAAQYLKKGSPVIIEGRLKQESWDDKQTGKKRSKLVVIVEQMTFVPRQKEGSSEDADGPPAPARPRLTTKDADAAASGHPAARDDEDDIPF